MSHPSLYDTLWNLHTVLVQQNGASLLYVDAHLIHEVTSPQAFNSIRTAGYEVHKPELTVGVPDHNIETVDSRELEGRFGSQVETLMSNCSSSLVECSDPFSEEQGIVHVINPERSITLPGKSIVCGDSHTSTHGALSTLSQGIGTSEVEVVLASQTVSQKRNRTFLIRLNGSIRPECCPKDIVLAIIGLVGSYGGTGYAIEFGGNIRGGLSVEDRMTICNMSIEAGAKFSLVAVDNTTSNFLRSRSASEDTKQFDRLCKSFNISDSTKFSRILDVDAGSIHPQVTWGTSPEMVTAIESRIPNPKSISDVSKRHNYELALSYMALKPNTPLCDIGIRYVFIGSCTNSRIEDLRKAAMIVSHVGGRISNKIRGALVVPGSGLVKEQAEIEGLDCIFKSAGFEWREPGCSLCIAMNQDKLLPLERCASTSNRNFEGRQGELGRTHLVSPQTAALAAMTGRLLNVRSLKC